MTEPPFRRVAIYGLGLIGGSIALALKHRWPSVVVVAIDRPQVLAIARQMGIANEGGDGLDAAAGSDLVILAAPVLQNVAALTALPRHVTRPTIVTDVGSTKRVMIDAARQLPEHVQFIGGHPLAGAAVSGLEAARPDLFEDRAWILTPYGSRSGTALHAVKAFVMGVRAVPQEMDAAEHDRLLAYISHLPQLAVSALMHVVGTHVREEGLALAGRGLRDTTRLASSPAGTWRDIVATNGENVAAALDDLIAALQRLRSATTLTNGDLDDVFVSAARWKGVLDHNS